MAGVGGSLVSYFDRHAWAYDLQLPLEQPALRVAARNAEPLDGVRIVDLAAGTGGLSAALLARSSGPASLTAVDASPRMLARAHRRLESRRPRAAFVVADVREVPLPDGCADLVAIGYLLHLLDAVERAAVLREASRLLAPDGRVVAVVHCLVRGRLGRAHGALWRVMTRVSGRSTVGGAPMRDLAPSLRAAGFTVLSSERVPGPYWSQVVVAAAVNPITAQLIVTPAETSTSPIRRRLSRP